MSTVKLIQRSVTSNPALVCWAIGATALVVGAAREGGRLVIFTLPLMALAFGLATSLLQRLLLRSPLASADPSEVIAARSVFALYWGWNLPISFMLIAVLSAVHPPGFGFFVWAGLPLGQLAGFLAPRSTKRFALETTAEIYGRPRRALAGVNVRLDVHDADSPTQQHPLAEALRAAGASVIVTRDRGHCEGASQVWMEPAVSDAAAQSLERLLNERGLHLRTKRIGTFSAGVDVVIHLCRSA